MKNGNEPGEHFIGPPHCHLLPYPSLLETRADHVTGMAKRLPSPSRFQAGPATPPTFRPMVDVPRTRAAAHRTRNLPVFK